MPEIFRKVPWDSKTFGFPCHEILRPTAANLKKSSKMRGHVTAKVDPLFPKKALIENGFYYCDTLLEPICAKKDFINHLDSRATLSPSLSGAEMKKISHEAYRHGRFHRDINISREKADARYLNWLKELAAKKQVFALRWEGRTCGYVAYEGPKLVLHALDVEHRGRGLSKFLWSAACRELYKKYGTLSSSISAANAPAINLYASLGFRMRNAVDVYHRFQA